MLSAIKTELNRNENLVGGNSFQTNVPSCGPPSACAIVVKSNRKKYCDRYMNFPIEQLPSEKKRNQQQHRRDKTHQKKLEESKIQGVKSTER